MTDEQLNRMLADLDGIKTIEVLLRSMHYKPEAQGYFSTAVDQYTEKLRRFVGRVRANRYLGNRYGESTKVVEQLISDDLTRAQLVSLSQQMADEVTLMQAAQRLDKLCRELQGEFEPE